MDYITFQEKLQKHSSKYRLPYENGQKTDEYLTSDLLERNHQTQQSFVDGATWVYENYEHYLRDETIVHTVFKEYYSHHTHLLENHETQQEMFSSGVTWAIEVLSSRKGLYRFFAYAGHMGELEGAFLATAHELDTLIGQYVSFGEILSGETELGFTIKPEHLILVTDDEHVISILEKENFCVGINPLDYLK